MVGKATKKQKITKKEDDTEDDKDDEKNEEEFARTTTRSGKLYSRLSRGHFATMSMLKKVHWKLFSMEPTMYIVGE